MKKFSNWLKKYFIPHEHNDYKPHFLRYKSMLVVSLAILVLELGFLAQVFLVFDKTQFLAAVLPGVLTSITNEERAEKNIPPLVKSDLLTKAAQLKAEDMAKNGYFAHTSPEGKTPWYWFEQVGYHYSAAGENLAVNFFESTEVAEAWMDSPSHRENILKKGYTEIGFGVAKGEYEGRNTVFVAELFGTPLTQATNNLPVPTPLKSIPVKPVTIPKSIPKTIPNPTPIPKTVPAPTPITPPTELAQTSPNTIVLGEEKVVNKEVQVESKIKLGLEKILTSPRQSVVYIYLIVISFIVLTIFALFIKSEIQHLMLMTRGFAVVAAIFLLIYINMKIFNVDTEVPTEGLSASVIAY